MSKEPSIKQSDEALFENLSKKKKKRKRNLIILIAAIAAGVIVALVIVFNVVSASLAESIGYYDNPPVAYEVTTGSLSTTVSGDGTISNVDTEQLTVPAGVTVDEVVVSANDTIKKGDLIATCDAASVAKAMSQAQTDLDKYDEQLASAADSAASESVKAGVSGRVKVIYASEGDRVADCMAENGALAVLSTDGKMAVDIDAGNLSEGDKVTVTTGGSTYEGYVCNITLGSATVLITDDGPEAGAEASVADADGNAAGKDTLYIHNPLAVTAYAGTVVSVNTELNAKVSSSSKLMTLTDTQFSASYETILRARNEKEDELLQLMNIYDAGGLTSPIDGCICSIDYKSDDDDDTDSSDSAQDSFSSMMAGTGSDDSSSSSSSSTQTTSSEPTAIATVSPDEHMLVTVNINESDILKVEEGQQASVLIYSIGTDTFDGTVTGILKTATTEYGTTQYQAEITIDKTEDMLAGMSAYATITIEGVEDALLVPAEAVHLTSDSAYVYTEYDSETKEYGGIREVTTGMQDEEMVEITDGLEEGDTVYYESAEEDFSMFGMGENGDGGASFSMDMQQMPGGDAMSGGPGGQGGGMPSGGAMPSGGGMPGGK